ncbi:hypothetical protein CJ177_10450 [Rhodococcus sp. ACPA1]|uniref:Uncharacterized protein n=1 Tax=Rhodococcus opacus TaxID=37919 RepID=A0A2S8IJG1_RHOOP|nr:hypothetical protein CJ177_10450 [Rhodococcus sp. ACPA1]PQP14921.1 hypothetical protein C5613_39660 [Rhodococcus opacus]
MDVIRCVGRRLFLPVVGVSLSWRCSRVLLWGAGGGCGSCRGRCGVVVRAWSASPGVGAAEGVVGDAFAGWCRLPRCTVGGGVRGGEVGAVRLR